MTDLRDLSAIRSWRDQVREHYDKPAPPERRCNDPAYSTARQWWQDTNLLLTEVDRLRDERDVYRRAEIRLEAERDRLRTLAVRLRDQLTIAHNPAHGRWSICGSCRLLTDPEVQAL